jgi:predicted nucleic acid-binding protein
MKRFILDTSKLINHWRNRRSRLAEPVTDELIAKWAGELIDLYQTDAIVTPVAVEFLGGFTTRVELRRGEVFLSRFTCVDSLDIREQDWRKVRQIVRRTPRDGKPRQLGDCLISAIAHRLGYRVITDDQGFPHTGS